MHMHPELIQQMALERTARFRRAADRYRQAREIHMPPREPVRTAIELRLRTYREEFERLIRRRGAAGPSTG